MPPELIDKDENIDYVARITAVFHVAQNFDAGVGLLFLQRRVERCRFCRSDTRPMAATMPQEGPCTRSSSNYEGGRENSLQRNVVTPRGVMKTRKLLLVPDALMDEDARSTVDFTRARSSGWMR
jgi:hypothetical protein